MKHLLIILLVSFSSFAFAQQQQRKPKNANEVEHITTDAKGSGHVRSQEPVNANTVVPSTSAVNVADSVKWSNLTQRKTKPAAKVDYNEIAK